MGSEEAVDLLKVYKYDSFSDQGVVMVWTSYEDQDKVFKDIGKILRNAGYTNSYGVRVKP